MGIFDKEKNMIENLHKAASIKAGQTTKEVFDTVERDELYSYKKSESNAILHSWKLPKSSSKYSKESQLVCVQLLIQGGIVVDGSHFAIENEKIVEHILKDGIRYKKQIFFDNEFEFDISRDKYNCQDEEYIDYLFNTIQYYDENKPFAFISYSSKDKEKVWSDVIKLQIKGYNLWIDKNMKETENSWQDSALKALNNPNCKLVIFYLSKSSITSTPCLRELKYRENKNIPYIVVEGECIGSFDSFIKSLDENNQVLNEMHPHFVSSSRKRIKFSNEKENMESYFSKVETNLNECDIKQLSSDELYSKAVKVFGETGQEYSAIAILDYCYSQGYLPAMLLRTYIKERPVFNDYFLNNKNIGFDKLQKISKKDEWLEKAELFKTKRLVPQAAAFYSAYALVNNDSDSYKEAFKMWKLLGQENEILVNSCFELGDIYSYKDGWKIESMGPLNHLFDLEFLTPFGVQYYVVSNTNQSSTTTAYDVSPDAIYNENKEPKIDFSVPEGYEPIAQVIQNYGINYAGHSMYHTTAGYYAVQLAVWGRLKGYDPANLTILSTLNTDNKALAQRVRAFASTLYNDYTTLTHGLNFKRNGETVKDSYDLANETSSIFYIEGNWYYRSEKMSITTYGTAANLSYTVSLDGEGFITTSAQETDTKPKTLTLGGDNGNVFYVFTPIGTADTETTVNISANYRYLSTMTWDFASGAYGSGQRMMSNSISNASNNYSVKLISPGLIDEPVEETKYTAKINFTKTGTGVADYSVSTANKETLYSLKSGTVNIDTYLIFYSVDANSDVHLLGKGAYETKNGKITVSKLPLESIDSDGYGDILVCEVGSPDGYGQFTNTKAVVTNINGFDYSCIRKGFDTAAADTDNVVTRDITENDKAKTFTVNVTKTDQNGTPLSGYKFGLYTTQDIEVEGKTTIPKGSLVAYVETGSDGKATFNAFLPASQNYILYEMEGGDKNTMITVNDNTAENDTSVVLDVLNNATVDGYNFDVIFCRYYQRIKYSYKTNR